MDSDLDLHAGQDRHLATGDYAGGLAIWDLENLKKPIWSGALCLGFRARCIWHHET